MGIAQCWHILILKSKSGQLMDDSGQLREQEIKGITLENKVGVVSAIA